MKTTRIVTEALRRLSERYPGRGALEVGDAYQILVLVMLSARTRDEQVLKLAPGFFSAFPTVERLAAADVAAIEKTINTIDMYKQKARNVKAMAQDIGGGCIPRDMEGLTALPGVGRKTASVVLSAVFGTPAIAVDTHVFRIVQRLGWVKGKTPQEVETRLREVAPQQDWATINHTMVPFGRSTCLPGVPRCWDCPLRDLCAYPRKQTVEPPDAVRIRQSIAEREAALAQLRKSVAAHIAGLAAS